MWAFFMDISILITKARTTEPAKMTGTIIYNLQFII